MKKEISIKISYKTLITILAFFVLLIIIPLIFLIFIFGIGFSNNYNDWGLFGDFFGGYIGSIFSFISILILIYTLYFQNYNFTTQINELRSDRSLNIFNNLIDHKSKILNNLSIENEKGIKALIKANEIYKLISETCTFSNDEIKILRESITTFDFTKISNQNIEIYKRMAKFKKCSELNSVINNIYISFLPYYQLINESIKIIKRNELIEFKYLLLSILSGNLDKEEIKFIENYFGYFSETSQSPLDDIHLLMNIEGDDYPFYNIMESNANVLSNLKNYL